MESLVPGALYLVATPIGNLADITHRAIDLLKRVATIYCEDTRTSATLLSAHGIITPTRSYHEHNETTERPRLLARLQQGESLALISDAGTPLISDPGYKLVAELRALNLPVIPLPGACALTVALSASGLPTDKAYFGGFLPPKSAARRTALAALLALPATLVFYESPRRLAETLADAAAELGDRPAVVARELTKKFEEFRPGSLLQLAAHYAAEDTPKGEIVLLIGGAKESSAGDIEAAAILRHCLAHLPHKQAAALAADLTGLPKRQLYQQALAIKGES